MKSRVPSFVSFLILFLTKIGNTKAAKEVSANYTYNAGITSKDTQPGTEAKTMQQKNYEEPNNTDSNISKGKTTEEKIKKEHAEKLARYQKKSKRNRRKDK